MPSSDSSTTTPGSSREQDHDGECLMSSPLRIVELVIGDAPKSWRDAGFAVDDDGCAQISTVRFRFVGDGSARGIHNWGVSGVSDGSIDGLAGALVEPVATEAPSHPNTTTSLDHIVIATADIDRTVCGFVAQGCEPRRERIGGSERNPIRQVFVRAGEVIIEIIGPPKPPERAEDRARPATFWGLAFTVADLEACAARLADACGTPKDAVQPGRRIATLRHNALGISVPTAFMS
jgi:hypothetical protein